jgi:hypothetical protein
MNNLNWDSWPVGSICVIDILVMFKCIADVVLGMQNQQNELNYTRLEHNKYMNYMSL